MREVVEGFLGGYAIGMVIGGAILLIVYAFIGALWLCFQLFKLICFIVSKAHASYVKKREAQAQVSDAQTV